MRISDWSSDVCSSDLTEALLHGRFIRQRADQPLAARPQQNRAAEPVEQRKAVKQIEIVPQPLAETDAGIDDEPLAGYPSRFGRRYPALQPRSEEHTSELQSLMRSSYHVFCLTNKRSTKETTTTDTHPLN